MQAAATTNLLYGSRDLPYAVSADLDAREEIARAKSRGCSCFTKATQQLRLAFHVVECTKKLVGTIQPANKVGSRQNSIRHGALKQCAIPFCGKCLKCHKETVARSPKVGIGNPEPCRKAGPMQPRGNRLQVQVPCLPQILA